MRRVSILATFLLFGVTAASAGDPQKKIRNEWRGAWVLTKVQTRSGCGDSYTANRISGNLVQGSGSADFAAGELAWVDKVDLKRERLDLSLTFNVPMLRAYEDGPFTLYEKTHCKIELEIVLPRTMVKQKDLAAITERVERVLERHATRDRAHASDRWNHRETEPYPEDYERTLALHAAWQAEQKNAEVHSAMAMALAELGRLRDRVRGSDDYARGFAEGVREAQDAELDSCSELLSVDPRTVRRDAGRSRSDDDEVADDTVEGFEDGQVFVYGITIVRDLPACYVKVPAIDEEPDE